MKKLIITGLLVAALPVMAQAQTAGAGAIAGASSNSAAIAGGGNAIATINNGGGGTYDVRNVPSVGAPGIIVGNSCAHGISAGGSGIGWGAAFGGTYLDKECNLRAEAGAIQAVVGNKAAVIHLARDAEMCETFRAAGVLSADQACPNDPKTRPLKAASGPGWSKCVLVDGAIRIRYTAAGRRDKEAAQADCKRSLGF